MEKDLTGNIFIIDISYYINYIEGIDHEIRLCIIDKLLRSIIRANHLSFLITETEDDTIFFFRQGTALPVRIILKQLEAILASFTSELDLLKYYVPAAHQPSVNLTIHYGNPGNLSKKERSNLRGTTIAGTYGLLKNKTVLHTRALITNQYLEAQVQEAIPPEGRVCELYNASTPRNMSLQIGTFSKTA